MFGAGSAPGAQEAWLKWFSPELRELEQKRAAVQRELDALGIPVAGQTVLEIGYQHERLSSPPLAPAWVQVDLLQQQTIDSIALVPALLDWQAPTRSAYGFPLRFRVDLATDPEFKAPITVGAFTETDFPDPGVAPLTIHAGGQRALYVRLTATKLAEENRQFFFALSELMVISGNLNVAIGCPVRASASFETPPHWSVANLVDGRTPLGPPINRELLKWDGFYAGSTNRQPAWMQLDLGRVWPLQQVRLHPVHAWLGANIPGFSFPRTLRVEVAATADFANAVILLDAVNFPNPGNNPVTLRATNTEARFVKVTSSSTNAEGEMRFGLSEIEVYSGGQNVAHSAQITWTPDRQHRSASWPPSLLVDGCTSCGHLLELPAWLHGWERRRELQAELERMDQREPVLALQAQRRAVRTGIVAALAVLLVVSGFIALGRYRRIREFHELRLCLARDIHDEIGSNIAGIAVLSEVSRDATPAGSVQREDWCEVNRIAQETLSAMHEVLWLLGSREEAGLDLLKHLQLAASRMLLGKEVHWKTTTEPLPPDWPFEARRQVFLVFKEALTNIVRHAQAGRVELSVEVKRRSLELRIADDGCGFDPAQALGGMGLASQQTRARSLGGTISIQSAPGHGTVVSVEVPLSHSRRLFSSKGQATT
jgi:signal transduction histidine kinase